MLLLFRDLIFFIAQCGLPRDLEVFGLLGIPLVLNDTVGSRRYLIPISLYVTLEIEKMFGALLISWDDALTDPSLPGQAALARTRSLSLFSLSSLPPFNLSFNLSCAFCASGTCAPAFGVFLSLFLSFASIPLFFVAPGVVNLFSSSP